MPSKPSLVSDRRRCHALSAEEANEAIRRFVADRRSWSRTELAELDRLRTMWKSAQRSGDTSA